MADANFMELGLAFPGDGNRHEYVDGNIKLVNILECNNGVMCVRFSPDGNFVAVGQADGLIKIFSPDTGQCLYSLCDDDVAMCHLPVTSIRFRPWGEDDKPDHKNIILAAYASGAIKLWHFTSGRCLHTSTEQRSALCAVYNPTGSRFLTCGSDPQINLYDVDSGSRIRIMEPSDSRDVMNGHRTRVFALQYHPRDPHLFVSGGWDDTVQFWDERQKHAIRKLYGPHICGDALDIDPVHNHLLTGSWRKDNVLQIWDFNTGEKIKDVPTDASHNSQLYCAQWVGKDHILCGGSEHHMARVIDRGTLNTVGQLVDLPSGVYCCDNDRQGAKPRVVAGAGKRAYVIKMEKKQI